MPDQDRKLQFVITAKDDGASSTINSVNQKFNELGKAAGGGGKSGKGFLDSLSLGSLSESFGRGSNLGQIGKLLAGGGAVFALSKITHEFGAMAEAGEKFADSLRMGTGNAGELSMKFAESLPILGNIVKAGGSINEMITGDKLALSEANKEAEQMTALTTRIRDNFKFGAVAAGEMKDQLSEIMLERAKIIGAPIPADVISFVQNAAAAVHKRNEESHKIIDAALNPKGGESFDALLAKQADLKRKLSLTFVPQAVFTPSMYANTKDAKGTPGVVSNQDEIDAAKKRLQNLKTELAPIEREIRARRDVAAPLQSLGWTKELAEIKNQGLRVVVGAEHTWDQITTKVNAVFKKKAGEQDTRERDRFVHQVEYEWQHLKDVGSALWSQIKPSGEMPSIVGAISKSIGAWTPGKKDGFIPQAVISSQLGSLVEGPGGARAQAAAERFEIQGRDTNNRNAQAQRDEEHAKKQEDANKDIITLLGNVIDAIKNSGKTAAQSIFPGKGF